MKTILLNGTNHPFPAIGLGTWQAKADDLNVTLTNALNIGYRHIDTAFNYNNEESIGRTLKIWLSEHNIDRNELFITTKLPNFANRAEDVVKLLKLSLQRLQLDYIDLYLIHVPFGFMPDYNNLLPKVDNDNYILDLTTDHNALWKAMEEVMEKGLTKNIGLSNFNRDQIENIYQNAKIKPQVLQVECHAYMQQDALRAYCAERNIILTAYSPLGSPGSQNHFMSKYNYRLKNCPDIFGNSTVKSIADNHQKTAAQVLLNYLVNRGVAVIPKTSNLQRLTENFDIFNFTLSEEEMRQMKELDMGENGRIIDFHFWKGAEKHPCYPF